MLNFDNLDKGLEMVSPVNFVYEFFNEKASKFVFY